MQICDKPSRRWILAAALLVTSVSLPACAQDDRKASEDVPPKKEQTLDDAARVGLTTLQQLAAGPEFQVLGLTSSEEAQSVSLGDKYDVFIIGLDRLREYAPGSGATALLAPSPDSVFPVLVDGQVRSSMTVTQTDGGFVASEVGGAELMQATARAADRAPGDFIVRVPALGLQFVGRRVGEQLMLTPVIADPRLPYIPGREVRAEAVVEQLVPIARAHNDEPM